MKKIIFILISVLALSCSSKKEEMPSDILPKEKFISVMIEMYMLEGQFSHANLIDRPAYDKGIAAYEKLFRKHRTDKKTVERSFDYYSQNPELMNEIYTIVLDSLNLRSK